MSVNSTHDGNGLACLSPFIDIVRCLPRASTPLSHLVFGAVRFSCGVSANMAVGQRKVFAQRTYGVGLKNCRTV
jgi:hypothetical protein